MKQSSKSFTVLHDNKLVEMTFEQMFKKFKRPVQHFILKGVKGDLMLAEELCDDVFIKVFKKLDTYNTEFAISTWIFTIAKHIVIDSARKKTLNTMSLDNVYVEWLNGEETPQTDRLIQLNDTENNPEERMIEKETMAAMYRKYEALNESEKIIAALHFFDGLSYDEVAKQLSMPLGTVKAKVHKARMAMMESVPVEMRKSVAV